MSRPLRLTALSAAIATCVPWVASAQLEEIVVTATRRETNLQDTPLSIQAFTSEQLELGGITNGRDLGIMVPNVVLNSSVGSGTSNFYVRGLPGVGIYVDGVWQGGFGFAQMDFAETERVEVLRGPQGTLFGRNTNGGAVNITTKRPADEFGARVKLNVGDFDRREAQLAVDLPLTDTLKTKFMGASLQNDGFMEGLIRPWDFGSQDDTILRFDALWEPTDNFTLRFTHNDEEKRGSDPKMLRMTRYDNSKMYAYNIMLGAFQQQANAACAADTVRCAAIAAGGAAAGQTSFFTGTGWAPPPDPAFGARTGAAAGALNYTTHMNDYQGGLSSAYGDVINGTYVPNPYLPDVVFGPGQVGKWQSKSDSPEDGVRADVKYSTVTADWQINDRLQFEAILSKLEQERRQVNDFDGTEFVFTTDDSNDLYEGDTLELHLSGSALDGRIGWLAGYYSLKENLQRRIYRWGMWEFVQQTSAVMTNGTTAPPQLNLAFMEYVRQTAQLLNLNGITGGNLLTANTAAPTVQARYPWMQNISSDTRTGSFDDDEAWFGEATFSVTDKIDLVFGARVSDKSGGDERYQALEAFRTADPDVAAQGDKFAGSLVSTIYDAEKPKINTYKFSVSYKPTADMMLYATYAEGFTAAENTLLTISDITLTPNGGTRLSPTQAVIPVPAEIVTNREIGLRSDWLDGRLRFNATYFDAIWEGMRVTLRPYDALGNTQPFPYQSGEGEGLASGFEFEVVWVPTDRLQLNLALGLIDTEYVQSGFFDGVNGNRPGSPFAYAADESGSIGAQYELPLSNGGRVLLVGNYGFTADYARDSAYQRTLIDADGNPVREPGYGILNSRVVYEPAARNYSIELWGKNLLDERYVNGGYDARDTWGYDFGIVGRAREVGLGINFEF